MPEGAAHGCRARCIYGVLQCTLWLVNFGHVRRRTHKLELELIIETFIRRNYTWENKGAENSYSVTVILHILPFCSTGIPYAEPYDPPKLICCQSRDVTCHLVLWFPYSCSYRKRPRRCRPFRLVGGANFSITLVFFGSIFNPSSPIWNQRNRMLGNSHSHLAGFSVKLLLSKVVNEVSIVRMWSCHCCLKIVMRHPYINVQNLLIFLPWPSERHKSYRRRS